MTFTRAWDFSGELSDLEVMTNGRLPCARSTDQAKSGSYSWKQTALDHAVVMGVPQGTTDLRSGFWIWASDDAGWGHIGIRGDMNVFKVGQQFSTNGGVRLVWYEDEERLDLQIDGVAQDTVALSTLPDWKIESWFHVAITASVTLGYASAYFNGEEILTYSGAIAHQPWDSVTCLSRRESWGFQNGGYMDDGYVDIMDGEGDTAPPMIQFMPSYTLSAGADAEFTPLSGANYQMVDEGAVPDDDTTYNGVLSSGAEQDTFNTDDIVLPADYEIVAVHPFAIVRKLDAAEDAQIENTAWDGILLAEGDSKPVPITYGVTKHRMETQPDGSDWTEADFNAMQFGYKESGSF